MTPRAARKRRRRIEADAFADGARFWRNAKTAERIYYSRPVNKAAARELKPQTRRKERP
jgi:hypothetical protein